MRAAILLLLSLITAVLHAAPPNLVLILADDCTARDLEVHGGQARTPRLNRLAEEGMTFTRCFQAAPMCAPTRTNLYTGLYPVKNGAYPNHSRARDGVRSIAHDLQAGGYRTLLSGKSHVLPAAVFPFEYSGLESGLSAQDPDFKAVDTALGECAARSTPFLLVMAFTEPHAPWNRGDPSAYPPKNIKLPPILADTPETRESFSRYLAEITVFDEQVGRTLDLLDRHGLSGNTVVMVLSEQGSQFPFAKWTCYDAGLHSACIVRWPGKVAAGSRSDALIEYVDVVPTFLEAAGLPRRADLDGRSFLPVLTGAATDHKDCVFGIQTTRGTSGSCEYYGVRSARDARYLYIRNLTPEARFDNAATAQITFKSWERAAKRGDTRAATLVQAFQHRPAEELYDCQADPWNRENLIERTELAAVRDRLSARLDTWMQQQGDLGQATEMAAPSRIPRLSKRAKD